MHRVTSAMYVSMIYINPGETIAWGKACHDDLPIEGMKSIKIQKIFHHFSERLVVVEKFIQLE